MPDAETDVSASALDGPETIQHVDAETAESAPTADIFDWTPHAEHLVTVKVKGEELQVPLKEALAGYQRQSDYTRDNQALAARAEELAYAEALAAAYETNPSGLVQYLASEAGVDLAALIGSANEPAGDLDALEPWQQKVVSFISEQEQQQQSAATQAAVEQELAAVKERFADVDEAAVLRHAIKTNLPLMAAAKDLMFDNVFEDALSVRQAREARAAEQRAADEAAAEAKRSASGLVSGGHTPSTGAVMPSTSSGASLRDILTAAMRQHGA